MSCAKNHDIERRRAVVKLPRAREKEREEDTVCSAVHNIFSRDVISEIHTRETLVSYVTIIPDVFLINRLFNFIRKRRYYENLVIMVPSKLESGRSMKLRWF